jgi:hypothetical protein
MKKDKNTNESGNRNKSGGSYKEKQPAAKPKSTDGKEQPVDEDNDGKADHSVNTKTPQRKDDRSLPQ